MRLDKIKQKRPRLYFILYFYNQNEVLNYIDQYQFHLFLNWFGDAFSKQSTTCRLNSLPYLVLEVCKKCQLNCSNNILEHREKSSFIAHKLKQHLSVSERCEEDSLYCCIFNMRSFLDVTCYHYTNSPSPTAKIATSLAILFQILYQCMIASLPQKLSRLTCVTPHLMYHQNISMVNFISDIILSFVKISKNQLKTIISTKQHQCPLLIY